MPECATCHGEAPAHHLNADGNCKDCADTKAAFEANEDQNKDEGPGKDGVITGDAPVAKPLLPTAKSS